MDTEIISRTWDSLAGRRVKFIESFYDHLFVDHPHYRRKFPASLDAQMERMVEMWSSVARFADHIDIIRPYLLRVGLLHRSMDLSTEDLRNFKEGFIAALADTCGEGWDDAAEAAWRSAFDDVVLPIVEEGLNGPTMGGTGRH